ncbi:synaptotagmin-1-like [Hemicordylus capensis]|uniref:synaptotagmin-1-like n=1 Tax=Hemicordylus capensis TaxID=884348 RepID=UPI002302243D|nr:synaptotagmin-1-like [Hemicordylus capensis]
MTQMRSSLFSLQSPHLPFSDIWKYGMLALSILLLLLALIILACQLCRCQKPNNTFGNEGKEADEETSFQEKRLRTSLLGIAQQPYHVVQIPKIQKELRKLGIYFSPSSASRYDVDKFGSDADVPDRSQGKLKFSLLYDRKYLELLLTVTGVLGLPSRRCTNTFIQVRLLRSASSQSPDFQHVVHDWQTQVVKNCTNPIFGDQFVCTLQEAELAKTSIKLEVKHFDKYSRHIPLGEVRVVLNILKTSQSTEFCEELQKVTKDTVGEVLVSLKRLPISQRIEVGLLKVKMASFYSNPEKHIYARIDVFYNLHKQKHQKSKPKALAGMTVFNETFLFHLPEPIVWDCAVLISIHEMHPSSRQLVGQAALGRRGPDNMNDHWDRMMQSIQQPVAKWHPLLI